MTLLIRCRRLALCGGLLVLAVLPLSACETTPTGQCEGFGYSRLSTPWMECVRQLEQAHHL